MARNLSTINPAGNSRREAYVVFVGRNPGVYLSWEETKEQVHRFSGQNYKGFDSLEEAREAFDNYQNRNGVRPTTKTNSKEKSPKRKTVKRRQALKMEDLPPWDVD